MTLIYYFKCHSRVVDRRRGFLSRLLPTPIAQSDVELEVRYCVGGVTACTCALAEVRRATNLAR